MLLTRKKKIKSYIPFGRSSQRITNARSRKSTDRMQLRLLWRRRCRTGRIQSL